MSRWILLILAIALSMIWGCGGKKLLDTGQGSGDEILFINDTPENSYRITVAGTDIDFTLRASTQKAVKVSVGEDTPSLKINMERLAGSMGEARISVLAKAGETVRISAQYYSSNNKTVIQVEVGGVLQG